MLSQDSSIIPTETNDSKWRSLQAAVECAEVRNVFVLFGSWSLDPILIKGWAATRHYPSNIPRYSTDIDVAFSSEQFETALQMVESINRRGLPLDLHNELRHLDSVEWTYLFDRSQIVALDGVDIRVLADEDHLRVLCIHWLTDGGWNKDRLWDIYYAVTNRRDDFDWAKCVDVVSENRRIWIIYTIGLAHRYLDLYIDDLSFTNDAKKIPKWLIKTVEREWNSGVQLQPLLMFTDRPRLLWQQILKRIPPNPIYSTVDMEGSLDAPTRIHYQIGSFFKRLFPGIKKALIRIKVRTL